MKRLLTISLLAAAAISHADNVVVNGDFEFPRVTSPQQAILSGSPALTGWTVSGAPTAGVDIRSRNFGGSSSFVYSGDQACQLGGPHGPATISQVLPVEPHTGYIFNLGTRGETVNSNSTYSVAVGGLLAFTTGQADFYYSSQWYLVTGNETSETLTIAGVAAPQGITLDSIKFFKATDSINTFFCRPVGYMGSCEGIPVTVEIRDEATQTLQHTVSGFLNPAGGFEFNSPIVGGSHTFSIDAGPWLKRSLHNAGLYIGMNDTLITAVFGDPDGSGEVDAADIDLVIANFGSTDPIYSDIDGSGEVDAADIDAVIANFGLVDE